MGDCRAETAAAASKIAVARALFTPLMSINVRAGNSEQNLPDGELIDDPADAFCLLRKRQAAVALLG